MIFDLQFANQIMLRIPKLKVAQTQKNLAGLSVNNGYLIALNTLLTF